MTSSVSTVHSVLLVAACPFPAPQGSQVYVGQLAQALAREGLSVRLLNYANLSTGRARPVPIKAGPSIRKLYLDRQLLSLLKQEVRTDPPDIIHAQNIEAFLIAWPVCRHYRIPLVYGVHGVMRHELETYFSSQWIKALARHVGARLDRFAARQANGIHLLDPASRQEWLDMGAAPQATAVIPPGFDLAAFDAIIPVAPPWSGSSLQAASPLIVYGGNLDDYQDIDLALESFALVRKELPAARLLLASHRQSGSYDTIVRRCQSSEGASCHQVDSFAEMKFLYAQADVLINPRSLRGGFPIKLMNYMASAKPIVSCRASTAFLEDQEDALLVDERNPAQFARAILAVMRNDDLARQLGRKARQRLEREFSWSARVEALMDLYQTARIEKRHARNFQHSHRTTD